jgi:hypothetical protein
MKLVVLTLAVTLQTADPARSLGPVASAPEGILLQTGTSVQALDETASLPLQGGLAINLEPGLQLDRTEGAYTFATYDGTKVEIEAGSDRLSLPSPVTALFTDRGWEFNAGKPVKVSMFTARRRQNQDDADQNLRSMQEAAKKLKTKETQPSRKLRVRWLYAENPNPTAEIFNTPAIQQLTHISSAGF